MTDKELHYRRLIHKGFAEKDAQRLATGLFQLSGIRTCATFAAGLDRVGVMADPHIRKHHLAKAKAAGLDTVGKVYLGGLASGPGAVDGWVTETDARAEIKQRCERNSWGCEGDVNVTKPEPESDPEPWKNADNLLAAQP